MEKHVFDLKDLNNFLDFPSLETILDYVVDSRYKELHKIFYIFLYKEFYL
jgi:hypothetical protein